MKERNQKNSRERPPVPARYAGKWIAWDADSRQILASGDDLFIVAARARRKGEKPIFEKVPHGFFIGLLRW